MTHCVEVQVRRFYKCYVEDENETMTKDEVVKKAMEMAKSDPDGNLTEDIELNEIEPSDILRMAYDYPVI